MAHDDRRGRIRGASPRKAASSSGPPRKVVLNLGSGPAEGSRLHGYFDPWQQVRIDVNAHVNPDIVASAVDIGEVADGTVDAVWSSHCIEHLLPHEVPVALREIRRVLRPTGFALIIVPDLQAIAAWVAEDRLHETIYESPAGPVTAHDMIWGFGPAIEHGELAMAHRCGFTPTLLRHRLQEARFSQILLRRRGTLELGALVTRRAGRRRTQCGKLMAALGFAEA